MDRPNQWELLHQAWPQCWRHLLWWLSVKPQNTIPYSPELEIKKIAAFVYHPFSEELGRLPPSCTCCLGFVGCHENRSLPETFELAQPETFSWVGGALCKTLLGDCLSYMNITYWSGAAGIDAMGVQQPTKERARSRKQSVNMCHWYCWLARLDQHLQSDREGPERWSNLGGPNQWCIGGSLGCSVTASKDF